MVTFAEDTGNWLDLGQTNPYTHGDGRFVSIQPNILGGAQAASWSLVTNNPNIQDDPLNLYNEASVLNHRWALPFKGFAMVPNLSDRHGVTLNPGLNYVYQPEYQEVRPHQQGELTTYVSASAPASIQVKGLSSTIALPRAGDALGSEVSLYLRGPLETDTAPTQAGTTAPVLTYSTDGTAFAAAAAGTDWAAITHVRLEVDTLMPGDAMGLVMPLRTEAWGADAETLRSGDLGKALMQASFRAESGFLTQQFDRMNTYDFLPNVISGFVWQDANADGFWQDGENQMTGIPVQLYEFADGASKRQVATTTTAAGGTYRFDTAAFHHLQLEVVLPTGYRTVPLTHPIPGNVFVTAADLRTGFTMAGTFAPEHIMELYEGVNAGLVLFAPVNSLAVQLAGQKRLEGGTLQDGQFTFTLTALADNPAGAVINTVTTVNTGGAIAFGPGALTFTMPGTYRFLVAETKGTLAGITYDPNPVQVTFQVAPAADGLSLAITGATYEKNRAPQDGILFENKQAYPMSFIVQGVKRVTGEGAVLQPEQFTFSLTGYGTPQTTTHDSNGRFTFQKMDVNEPGVINLVMTEVKGTDPNVRYDDTRYDLRLNFLATPNAQGGFIETTMLKNGEPAPDLVPEFVNVITPPEPGYPTLQVPIGATKVMRGGTLRDGQFAFELRDEAGNVTAATNDASGSIAFPDRALNTPGTFVYTIHEVEGTQERMTYDTAVWQVNITTTPNGDVLQAAVEYLKDDVPTASAPVFTNILAPEPPDPPVPPDPTYPTLRVPIGATKVLRGGMLREGQFTFELLDGAGKVITTATNDATGAVTFPDRTFSRTGTFLYTIREVAGTQERMAYDTAEWQVIITTTPSGGVLQAAVDYLKDDVPTASAPVFTNTVKLPPTGDRVPTLIISLLLAAIASLGAAWLIGRRRTS